MVLVEGKMFAMKNGKYDQYFVDINLTLMLRDIIPKAENEKNMNKKMVFTPRSWTENIYTRLNGNLYIWKLSHA